MGGLLQEMSGEVVEVKRRETGEGAGVLTEVRR